MRILDRKYLGVVVAFTAATVLYGCGSEGTNARARGSTTPASLVNEGGPLAEGIPWSSSVVANADDTKIYFNDWDGSESGGVPSVGLYERSTDERTTFVKGALAPVLRKDGLLAFARGQRQEHQVGKPYPTDVVVRTDSGDEVWVQAEENVLSIPVAWAKETLVVLRISATDGTADALLAQKGGAVKVLDGLPLALSPDGTAVLSSTDRSDPARLLVVTDTGTFGDVDTIGFDEYAAAFLPGSGEEDFDRADLRPGPEGSMPVGPATGFGIWTKDSLVLQGAKGLLVFDTTQSPWNLTPRAFLRVGSDQPPAVNVTTSRIGPLPHGDIAVVVELVDQAAIISGPPPKKLTHEEAKNLGEERERSRANATSASAYRCDIDVVRCTPDASVAAAASDRTTNHSR